MNNDFRQWNEDDESLEMHFPEIKRHKGQMSFNEWRWRETLIHIRKLPEISYEDLPELLE